MTNIHTRSRSGFIRRGGVRRRETLWLSEPIVEATLAGSPTAVAVSSLSAAGLALRPFTIVRSHIRFMVFSDQSIAAEAYGAALGYAVVSDQATAIGVTALPTPITDASSDLWFLYQLLFSRFLFKDATGVLDPSGVTMDIDSRAMRKVEEGQDFVGTVENTINGCQTITGGRFLLKLH